MGALNDFVVWAECTVEACSRLGEADGVPRRKGKCLPELYSTHFLCRSATTGSHFCGQLCERLEARLKQT